VASSFKNKTNNKIFETLTKTEIETVFLPGSKTTSKRSHSPSTEFQGQVDEVIKSETYENELPSQTVCEEFVSLNDSDFVALYDYNEDETRGSKESDCAIGPRTLLDQTCTEFDSESLYWNQKTDPSLYNTVDIDNNLLPVKTEAQEVQESPLIGGCLLDSIKPDPDMADPFFEEYLDLNSLFPDLVPGFDPIDDLLSCCNDKMSAVKEIEAVSPSLDAAPKMEDSTPCPSPDIMKEIDNLLAEAEQDVIPNTIEELLDVEIVDEAPTDNEQSDFLSSCVSSPGSVNSTADSCVTIATEKTNVGAELQYLLELLESTDTQELETIEANELCLEISQPKSLKRKLNTDTSNAAQVAKRSRPLASTNVVCDRATARRIKNNAASRNCRASRKQREQELFVKEEELLKSNAELKAQLEQLTKDTEALRKVLVQRLSGASIIG